MRTLDLLTAVTICAASVNAMPLVKQLDPRTSLIARRDYVLGGLDHLLMRREKGDKAKYEIFCTQDGRTKENWNKLGMGPQLELESNLFYDDGPCGKGPYPSFKGKSFMDAISGQVDGYGTYGGCHMETCDPIQPDEKTACRKNHDNPMWLMFMYSIKNYADYMKELKEGLNQGFTNTWKESQNMVEDFSTPAEALVQDKTASNSLIITAGALAGLGAALGLISPVAGSLVGGASGMATMALGIVNSAQTKDPAVQEGEKDKRQEVLSKRLDSVKMSLNQSIDDWGVDLIDNDVWFPNKPYDNEWYSDRPRSLVQVLHKGEFVDKPDSHTADEFADKMKSHFRAGALSYIWGKENVFIIKLKSEVKGTKPCDIDWDTWDTEAICMDGVAYVFHKVKSGHDALKEDARKLDKPYGYDKVESDYGLDYKKLIRAAEESQKGGYFKKWTSEEALGSFDDPDDTKTFNIPVCDLDDNWTAQSSKGFDYKFISQLIYWNVAHCTGNKDPNDQPFPYDINNDYYS